MKAEDRNVVKAFVVLIVFILIAIL